MKGLDTTTNYIILGVIAVVLIVLIITFIILLKKNKKDKKEEISLEKPLNNTINSNDNGVTTLGTTTNETEPIVEESSIEPTPTITEEKPIAPVIEEKPIEFSTTIVEEKPAESITFNSSINNEHLNNLNVENNKPILNNVPTMDTSSIAPNTQINTPTDVFPSINNDGPAFTINDDQNKNS